MSDGAAHTRDARRSSSKRSRPAPGELVIDGTFGAGGYSRAFLARARAWSPSTATQRAAASPPAGESRPLPAGGGARFPPWRSGSARARPTGVALDLGLSSMQLDEAERGFSLMRDGPLDMRMGGDGRTAADLVNEAEPAELARIFWSYGEEPRARAASPRAIVAPPRRGAFRAARSISPRSSNRRWADAAAPGSTRRPGRSRPCASRSTMNWASWSRGLGAAERVLSAGGRLAVVSFHSLEDRIVKTFLDDARGAPPGGSRHAPPRGPGPRAQLPAC